MTGSDGPEDGIRRAASHDPARRARVLAGGTHDEATRMIGRHAVGPDRDAMLLVGRVLLVLLFLAGGFLKIKYLSGTAAYLGDVGVPGAGPAVAMAAGLIECACALCILAGYRTRLAAAVLVAYLLPATWYTHLAIAQNASDAVVRDNEVFQTLKNVAVMGGLALLAVAGPGAHSLDRK